MPWAIAFCEPVKSDVDAEVVEPVEPLGEAEDDRHAGRVVVLAGRRGGEGDVEQERDVHDQHDRRDELDDRERGALHAAGAEDAAGEQDEQRDEHGAERARSGGPVS